MTFDDVVIERIRKICELKNLASDEKIEMINQECQFSSLIGDETRERIEKLIDGVPVPYTARELNKHRAKTKSKIRNAVIDDIKEHGEPAKVYNVDGIQVDVVYETDDGSETIEIFY